MKIKYYLHFFVVVFYLVLAAIFLPETNYVYAQLDASNCGVIQIFSQNFPSEYFIDGSKKIVSLNLTSLTPGKIYNITVNGNYSAFDDEKTFPFSADSSGKAMVDVELRSSPFWPYRGYVYSISVLSAPRYNEQRR